MSLTSICVAILLAFREQNIQPSAIRFPTPAMLQFFNTPLLFGRDTHRTVVSALFYALPDYCNISVIVYKKS